MTRPDIHITGMPYVPGVAHGVLQRGMSGEPAGHIVMLDAPLPGPFPQPPAGFVVIDGAPLSHAMIPLLGSGVPSVIITREQARRLQEGRVFTLDGTTGRITTAVIASAVASTTDAPATTPAPASAHLTADGTRVLLRASARDTHAVHSAVVNGAESIGLVRSEFLEPGGGRLPDAAFYRTAFRGLCEAAGDLPVTIRLIDIATDKQPSWLSPEAGVGGVLGRQGVRLYQEEPIRTLWLAQLEAIDVLAGDYYLRVLLPYVADRTELDHWVHILRRHLPPEIPVGAMAETPAAALQLGEWLDSADFAGIGCNDLMQYLFGADRDRPEQTRYLDPYAPVLYRFLDTVAVAAPGQLDRVQLCGVLPQLPGILPLLLGLGFRVFSVEATMLSRLGQVIANTHITDAAALAVRVCQGQSSGEVRELLQKEVSDHSG